MVSNIVSSSVKHVWMVHSLGERKTNLLMYHVYHPFFSLHILMVLLACVDGRR